MPEGSPGSIALFGSSLPTRPSAGIQGLELAVDFSEATCRADVRIATAHGSLKSSPFPDPDFATTRAFRVESADTCDLKKIQRFSPSATAHRCVIQYLTVRVAQLDGPVTETAVRDSCVRIGLLARTSSPTAQAEREESDLTLEADRTTFGGTTASLTLSLDVRKGVSTDGVLDRTSSIAPKMVVKQCER